MVCLSRSAAADGCATQPETALDVELEDGQFDVVSLSAVDTDDSEKPSSSTVSWIQVMSTSLSGSFQNAGNSP